VRPAKRPGAGSPSGGPPARPCWAARAACEAGRLDAGESIKALSGYLGHSDPGFTLRAYTHLLPASEDRTRRAIDAAFADDPLHGTTTPDGMETA
jgi:integrase